MPNKDLALGKVKIYPSVTSGTRHLQIKVDPYHKEWTVYCVSKIAPIQTLEQIIKQGFSKYVKMSDIVTHVQANRHNRQTVWQTVRLTNREDRQTEKTDS